MGLADLKKNATRAKHVTPGVSLEDFIDGATLYANGIHIPGAANDDAKPKGRRYKNATFSLNDNAATQLTVMTADNHISKSKLIRVLINEHYHRSWEMQHLIETQSPTE